MAGENSRHAQRIRSQPPERDDRALIEFGDRVVQEDGSCWINVPAPAANTLKIGQGDALTVELDVKRGELIYSVSETEG